MKRDFPAILHGMVIPSPRDKGWSFTFSDHGEQRISEMDFFSAVEAKAAMRRCVEFLRGQKD